MNAATAKRLASFKKQIHAFCAWLSERGAEVLVPTNEWEILRFAHEGSSRASLIFFSLDTPMRKPYAKKIDATSTEMLKKFDLFSAPVDVKAFAERLGATVLFDELEEDVSGFLLREKEVATIAVNQSHHPNRQRFTIAHECGHLHLHADQGDRLWVDKHTTIFYRNAGSSSGEQKAEIEANQFAAGLLMPEKLLMPLVTDEMSDLDIFRLALRFQVSEQAMMLRLASLDVLETT